MTAWMRVELMGHVQLSGLVDEVEMFGAKFGRVRVPGRRVGDKCLECRGTGKFRDWNEHGNEIVLPCVACGGAGAIVTADPEWIHERIFGAASVYSLVPITEESARVSAANSSYAPRQKALPLAPQPEEYDLDPGAIDDSDDEPNDTDTGVSSEDGPTS